MRLMEKDEFIAAGQALYGRTVGWKAALAEALDLSKATITLYCKGERVIPLTVKLAIETLKQQRIKEIANGTQA